MATFAKWLAGPLGLLRNALVRWDNWRDRTPADAALERAQVRARA